jgi:hypothetical protein
MTGSTIEMYSHRKLVAENRSKYQATRLFLCTATLNRRGRLLELAFSQSA